MRPDPISSPIAWIRSAQGHRLRGGDDVRCVSAQRAARSDSGPGRPRHPDTSATWRRPSPAPTRRKSPEATVLKRFSQRMAPGTEHGPARATLRRQPVTPRWDAAASVGHESLDSAVGGIRPGAVSSSIERFSMARAVERSAAAEHEAARAGAQAARATFAVPWTLTSSNARLRRAARVGLRRETARSARSPRRPASPPWHRRRPHGDLTPRGSRWIVSSPGKMSARTRVLVAGQPAGAGGD